MDGEDQVEDGDQSHPRTKESLLAAAARTRKDQPEATEAEKQLAEEQDMLKHILAKQALKSVKELAQVTTAYLSVPCNAVASFS